MKSYILRRFIYMILTLVAVSIIAFVLIQLPPGTFLDSLIEELEKMGGAEYARMQIAALNMRYGLDAPVYVQYFKWMKGIILHGDFGMSYAWNRSVVQLIAERIPVSILISSLATIFVYLVAVPIGIYSAIHQYSITDYVAMVVGFIGLAIPNFLLALIFMIFFLQQFGWEVGGLFSHEYLLAPWSVGKFIDLLKHIPIPIVVIGTAGTAGLIRVLRSCLLDELHKQYVITARTKGLSERTLLFKYPVRVAINPMISTIGWMLPGIFSGETITAIVIGIPSIGPLLFSALRVQDMYLAGAIIMFLGFLTVVGTFVSDMLLVLVDPRIRYEK